MRVATSSSTRRLAGAATLPIAAQAQVRQSIPVIGYLDAGTAGSDESILKALRQGLDQGGYVEGRNVEILFSYAEFQQDRLRSLATDLVQRGVAVIVATGGAPGLAAKEATAKSASVRGEFTICVIGLVRSWSAPVPSTSGARNNSRRWRPATRCQRSSHTVRPPSLAACDTTELCKRIWEEPMKIARLKCLVLAAAAAAVLQAGAAQAAMKTQWIDYKQGNTALSGYLVYDDASQGRRPGVLMIHDRSGFSEGTIEDAEMIAKLGYVVFAEDIFAKAWCPNPFPR